MFFSFTPSQAEKENEEKTGNRRFCSANEKVPANTFSKVLQVLNC